METNDIIAIVLGCIANSVYNIGLVFKKKGACTLPEIENQTIWQNIKNFTRCKTWVLGWVLTMLQWFPLTFAIRIGSLSLVAPTMAVGFIVLILFSWLFLKEPISIMEILGIVVITIAILMLYTGKTFTETGEIGLDEIVSRFGAGKGYGTLIGFAILIGILLSVTVGRKYRRAGALMAMGAGLSYALATIFAKGAMGSLDFSSGAAFVENSLARWEWWIFLIVMIMLYTVAFASQQMAFQKGKAIVVSPILDIMNLFLQMAAGIIIFAEWYQLWPDLPIWQKTLKIISVGLVFVGVAMLSFFTAKDGLTDDKIEACEPEEGELNEEKIGKEQEIQLEEEEEKKPSATIEIDGKIPETKTATIVPNK